jgi:hypothetical protein
LWDKALRLAVDILQQKWIFFYKYANFFIVDTNCIGLNSFAEQVFRRGKIITGRHIVVLPRVVI